MKRTIEIDKDRLAHKIGEYIADYSCGCMGTTHSEKKAVLEVMERVEKEPDNPCCCEDFRIAMEDYKNIKIGADGSEVIFNGSQIEYCPFCGTSVYSFSAEVDR